MENEKNTNVELETKPTTPVVGAEDKKEDVKPSLEEQLKQALIENAKIKKQMDKAAHEAADYKKQLRAKQTEDEVRIQEKAEQEAEREAEFQRLLKENQVNKLEKNFVVLGYPEDKAHEAAVAQYEGDTDTLFRIQNDVQQNLIKAKEAEWLASRPQVNVGVGNEDVNITKEQFDNFGYSELVEFKNKYPETYKKFAQ